MWPWLKRLKIGSSEEFLCTGLFKKKKNCWLFKRLPFCQQELRPCKLLFTNTHYRWCPDSVVGIMARLRVGQSGVRNSVRVRDLSFPNRPDRLWALPRLLLNARQASFPGVNRPERVPPRVKNERSSTFTSPVCLNGVDRATLPLCPPASKFKDNERVCYPVGADYTPSIGFPYGGSSSPRLELVTG